MTEPMIRARREMVGDAQYPKTWMPLSFVRRFTASEYERIAIGVIPRDMDDKWYIYLEDDTLYFHRSWTGLCVFRIGLRREGNEFVVTESAVGQYPRPPIPWWSFWRRFHRNQPSVSSDLSEEIALLALLVDVALLGKPDPRVPGGRDHGS